MMNRYGFVIFVVSLHAAAHRSVLGLCSSVAMYASAASALPTEAVPEQHAQGSGRGPARRHAPAAAATRATSRVGVRVRTAVNTPRCCAGIRGLSGKGKGRGRRSVGAGGYARGAGADRWTPAPPHTLATASQKHTRLLALSLQPALAVHGRECARAPPRPQASALPLPRYRQALTCLGPIAVW